MTIVITNGLTFVNSVVTFSSVSMFYLDVREDDHAARPGSGCTRTGSRTASGNGADHLAETAGRDRHRYFQQMRPESFEGDGRESGVKRRREVG